MCIRDSYNSAPTDGNFIIVSAISIDGVNHEREAIWSMEDNQGSNNDIQLRAGNQSQFNGAFEVENLGFSSNTKNFTGGPYSGNNLNTSVLNGSSNTYFARMDCVQRLSGTDYTTNVDGRKLKLWLFSNRTGNRELEGKFGEMVMYNLSLIHI